MSNIIEAFSKSLPEYLRDVEKPWGRLFYDLTWYQMDQHLVQERKKVLDVGCGFGLSSVRFSELGHQVTGMDMTPDMLTEAKERADQRGQDITFLPGSVEELEKLFEDQRYDWIMCHNVLEYVQEPANIIKQLEKLLSRGGYLSLITHNPASKVLQKAIIDQELDKAKESIHQKTVYNPLIQTDLHIYQHDMVCGWLQESGFVIEGHYGIRCISDYLASEVLTKGDTSYKQALALEKEVAQLSPYREMAPFSHIVAHKP